MHYFSKSLLILSVLFANLQQIAGQSPSASSCEKYCHSDCSQYFQHGNGDFDTCVNANVYCSCGIPPPARIFAIIALCIAVIIVGYCIRKCKQINYSRSNISAAAGGPIRPNVGGEYSSSLSQPVVTQNHHYPVPQNYVPPVYPQASYNPGVPTYIPNGNAPSIPKIDNEEPPSYSEVIRADAAAMQTAGWNIGSSPLANPHAK